MRILKVSIASMALIGAASPIAAQQAATTIQQDFEAAAALDAGSDKQAALNAWEALERRTMKNRRSHAIVLVRKSAALLELDRKDEAVAAARAGLAGLPADDASLSEDRYRAYINLARIAQGAVDYASAMAAYRDAASASDGVANRFVALLGLIQTATFVDPAVAADALGKTKALIATTKTDSVVAAEFARREGLLLLNDGDFAGARVKSAEAVKLLGGLTTRVDLRDVSARSDTAIAALLAGDGDSARKYMAYTGAGRLPEGSFDPAVQMKAPSCGGEGGLKPDDMAVVEFSIGDDGTVTTSTPIYAAGGGPVALEFARAALGWSWTPEQVKALPRFFRYNIRIEMRCSTEFQRPSIGDFLSASLESWMTEKRLPVPAADHTSDAVALPRQRAALAAAEAKGAESIEVLPPLYRLMRNVVVPREETNVLARRALAIADANGVPPVPRLALDIVERGTARAAGKRGGDFARAAMPLLSQPLYTGNPQARSVVRLLIADADERSAGSRTRELLHQVADDQALAANDPMRVGALVRIASIEQQSGNAAAAREAFERSGLAANQCGIIDSAPKLLHAGGVYPQEATAWGFEGWTQTQFDVAADGRVVNERAVLSYPPFVFTKAGVRTMAGARYAKSYRPDGSLGCGASTQRVRFLFGR
ncbi:MAG: hypothetical protein P0Y59_07670 [Candidatus Sphingomonas phytovorans]|nr:hypothetical protein [Sphingomonas sp.]WEK01546.1 MAG: hypothetical protein P0Y59_07670 [Sphingomonas sp.]